MCVCVTKTINSKKARHTTRTNAISAALAALLSRVLWGIYGCLGGYIRVMCLVEGEIELREKVRDTRERER